MRLGEFNGVMIKHNGEKTETEKEIQGEIEQFNKRLYCRLFLLASMFYPDTFEVVEPRV